jgi:phytoene dehydrogenase-like protein
LSFWPEDNVWKISTMTGPIQGLYLCRSTTHPHGFITFGAGYNALQVIADDFWLDKWWVDI